MISRRGFPQVYPQPPMWITCRLCMLMQEAVMPEKLRMVTSDEITTRPKTVTEAANAGTSRELLVAMRTRIAMAVEDPNAAARDLASLTKRLMEVVRDIEAIDARDAQEIDDSAPADEAWTAI